MIPLNVSPHPALMPKIIAHRGANNEAPENTLAAIYEAAQMGARAIEFDATISKDGIAVVMHDFNVDRCTDGSGPVILKSLDEISALDAGSWHGPAFKGEQIPTLKDALTTVMECDLALNLEIKPTLGWEEPTARAVVETLNDVWPKDRRVLVSSMNPVALDVFHESLPDVPLGLIVYAIPENWAKRLDQHHCASLHCYHAFVTADVVAKVHDTNRRVHVYTVNDLQRARDLFAMGVDAIFTDNLDHMLALS